MRKRHKEIRKEELWSSEGGKEGEERTGKNKERKKDKCRENEARKEVEEIRQE